MSGGLHSRVARFTWHLVLVVSVSTVLALAAASPASGQLSIRTDLDTTLVTVGDRITLSVRVSHPEDAAVIWPDSLDMAPFEVLGAQALPVESANGSLVSSAVFVLSAFELGELEIPAFDVDVIFGDGSRETLSTDRFGVDVVSIGADETGDIREIRGPLMIPVSVIAVAGWLLLLLLAVFAGAWGYRRWVRSRAGDEAVPAGPPPRPPHEIALEALDQLEASELLARGDVKAFHITASDILRRYVEARFQVTALEMTTWEILDGLARVGVGQKVRDDLRRFLDQCDLVKFAKVRPESDASRVLVQLGRELVLESQNDPDDVSSSDDVGVGAVSDATGSEDEA